MVTRRGPTRPDDRRNHEQHRRPSRAGAAPAPRRDRTHYLYLAVIGAVVAGIVVGLVVPDVRGGAQAARHGVRRPDQDDDPAGHLLHDRDRRRLGRQRRPRRQGRRPRARLLPHDVDRRPGHRPGRRQHPAPGLRAPAHRRARRRRPGAGRQRSRQHDRLPARHHPDLDALLADLRRGAADAARRAARRLRAAADGQGRQADPARHHHHPAAGLPGAGDDHVGRPGRCLRRHGRRGRRDRCRRSQEPRRADARLLPHLRALRLRRARHDPAPGHRRQRLQAAALPRPRVPADRLHVVVGVGAAAPDRQDGARRRRQADRRRRRADRLLLQPRRHRDLPDDGLAVHRLGAWATR